MGVSAPPRGTYGLRNYADMLVVAMVPAMRGAFPVILKWAQEHAAKFTPVRFGSCSYMIFALLSECGAQAVCDMYRV